MKDRNQLLLDFASDWTLDGDLLRCRSCNRAQIASRQDEDFVHRSDCEKNRTGGRPWTVLQSILLTMLPGYVRLAAARDAARAEAEKLRARLREANQTIVACIGASGPDAAEEAAKRAVEEIEKLRAELAAVTAQRDELLRAAVKVLNTSPRTSSSNPRELDHMDACTDLGVAVERIARAQPEQPQQPQDGAK